jgi:hypothetical protein
MTSSKNPFDSPETIEEWEQVRRSMAMLPPGAWAMRRELSLDAIATIIDLKKDTAAPA